MQAPKKLGRNPISIALIVLLLTASFTGTGLAHNPGGYTQADLLQGNTNQVDAGDVYFMRVGNTVYVHWDTSLTGVTDQFVCAGSYPATPPADRCKPGQAPAGTVFRPASVTDDSWSFTYSGSESSFQLHLSIGGETLIGNITIPTLTAASATVDTGECVFANETSSTPVTITVTPADSVTVVIKEGTTPLHTLTSTQTVSLPPGNYDWTADAASGFSLTTPASGSFEVDDCTPEPDEASATVDTGDCVFANETSSTPVTITVTPSDSVTVTVKEGATVLHTITSTTTINLAPGSYTWEAVAADGYELTTPASGNIETGRCAPAEPDDASATVDTGECVFANEASSTPVTITVTPSDSVTVTVKEGATVLHTITSTTTINLAPGSYTWEAVAADGYELTTPASGNIETSGCAPVITDNRPATASVSPGACVFNVASSTPVTSLISPANGASVVLTRATGGFTHTFTGTGGSVSVSPGTYNWVASPASGFTLTGVTSGSFQAVNCAVLAEVFEDPGPKPVKVLGVQFAAAAALPKTGASVAWMLWFAFTAMLTGLWITFVARNRELGYKARHKAPREWHWGTAT